MKLTIVLKKQDAIGLGGQILEAMGMHRSIYEPEVFVVQHIQDPRLVAPVDVTESMWPIMYLEALMDEGIKPLRVYQKDNTTWALTPLYASMANNGLSRTAVADMLEAAASALEAGCGCEEGSAEGTCQCGEACEPGPDGLCLACGLSVAETIENALPPTEGEAPNVMNEIIETAPLNAGKVSADSPEPVAILSALGKIPGIVSANQVDSWRESDGVYWYNCALKLEPTVRKSAKAYRNGPIIQVVTDFKNKSVSVAKAAKKAVEAAGGYNVQVSTPNRKKAWVDPEFPRDESEASSYFENGAAVLVEFLWQPGEASASVHPAVANAIEALAEVADMLEADLDAADEPCDCEPDDEGNCNCDEPAIEVDEVEAPICKATASGLDLSDEEAATAVLLAGLKPFARAERLAEAGLGEYNAANPVIQALVKKGLVKVTKTGIIPDYKKTKAAVAGRAPPEAYKKFISNPFMWFKYPDSSVDAAAPVFDKKTWRMTREKANEALEKAGFDGNGRFRTIGQANAKLAQVLSDFGIQIGDVMSADRFREDARTQNFSLELVNEDDSFSPVAFDDSMVHYSYAKLSPDRIEVVAYLS